MGDRPHAPARRRLRSANSRRCLVSDLRTFYRWARRRGLLTIDPTDGIGRIRVPKRLPTPIPTPILLDAIARADPTTRRMMMLGAYAGLRVSEIAALDRYDIDCSLRVIRVRDGKGGKDRDVPMAPELVDELRNLPAGPVFGVCAHTVSDRIRRHFRTLGIDHRPHDLRHTFATACARNARNDLEAVAVLLGHDSAVTTRRYAAMEHDTAALVDGLYAAA